jgi:23S rRNA (cytosine1962-C5)-methyltransferase
VVTPTVWLRPRKSAPSINCHPWVFVGSVGRIEGMPAPGAAVRVVTVAGEFIAWGLFNPESAIRVRLYSWKEAEPLTDEFFASRVARAIASRVRLFGDGPELRACRLIFSEGDGLSGLTVDRYGDYLLMQWTSLALSQREGLIASELHKLLKPVGIWRRTDTGVMDKEGLPPSDGRVSGSEPPGDLTVVEHGVQYRVDIRHGQKTGFYFDQRDNRRAVAQLCQGRKVLDVCCYSGGFALTALARGGAAHVTAVDGSASALELATGNAERNGLADRATFVKSDAWTYLEQARDRGDRYDVVILDPPKLAKGRGQLDAALRGYHGLNTLALGVLAPGGLLATCSCSGLVQRTEFEMVLADAALSADRPLRIIDSRCAAPDHPVSVHCPESGYLKCVLCLG